MLQSLTALNSRLTKRRRILRQLCICLLLLMSRIALCSQQNHVCQSGNRDWNQRTAIYSAVNGRRIRRCLDHRMVAYCCRRFFGEALGECTS